MKISKLISTLIIVSLTGIQFSCDELITLGQYVGSLKWNQKAKTLQFGRSRNRGLCANEITENEYHSLACMGKSGTGPE